MGNLNYENRSIERLLLGMALPIMFKFLISELYSMVDTYFVGVYLGHGALAALSLGFPMQRLLWALSVLVGVGTSTRLSRHLGRKDLDGASQTMVSGASLLLCIQVPVVLLCGLFPQEIMGLFGARGDTLLSASGYLRYTGIGSLFLALSSFLSYLLLCLGNNRLSLVAMILGAMGNGILDYLFLGVFHWGVEAAGLASMISQILSGLYILVAFTRFLKDQDIHLKFRFSPKLFPLLFLGGLAAFIVEIEDSIVMTVLNRLLLSSVGEEGVAILGVVTKLTMFLFITLFGVVSAMQPLAGYFYGAKNKKKLRELLHKSLRYSFLFTLVPWMVFQFKAEAFVGIFLKDPLYVEKAAPALRMVIALFPLTSVYYLGIFYHQAKGDVRRALLESLLRQLLILLPMALLLSKGFGLGAWGVWVAFPLTDGCAALFSLLGFGSQGLLSVLFRGEKEPQTKLSSGRPWETPAFQGIDRRRILGLTKKEVVSLESLVPR